EGQQGLRRDRHLRGDGRGGERGRGLSERVRRPGGGPGAPARAPTAVASSEGARRGAPSKVAAGPGPGARDERLAAPHATRPRGVSEGRRVPGRALHGGSRPAGRPRGHWKSRAGWRGVVSRGVCRTTTGDARGSSWANSRTQVSPTALAVAPSPSTVTTSPTW